MSRKWHWLIGLLALGLFGCSAPTSTTPLDQIVAAETAMDGENQTLFDTATSAFSDLLPASLSAQATSTTPRPITLVDNAGDATILIGGPWRPPFPWPIPNGPSDLDGKPLILAIKVPQEKSRPSTARLGVFDYDPNGSRVLWYGPRGAAPIETPAVVEERPLTPEEAARFKVKFTLFSKKTTENPDGTTTTEVGFFHVEADRGRVLHITAPLPDSPDGRPIDGGITQLANYQAALGEVCCKRPKPFPPSWPPLILSRPDLSLVVAPYQNPKLQQATGPEDLIDQNLAMVYLHKKPFPPGTITDCGGLPGVWCPPPKDPFYTLRLARDQNGWVVQLTHLNDTSQVIATLPAQVRWSDTGTSDIGIEDRLPVTGDGVIIIKIGPIIIIIIIG